MVTVSGAVIGNPCLLDQGLLLLLHLVDLPETAGNMRSLCSEMEETTGLGEEFLSKKRKEPEPQYGSTVHQPRQFHFRKSLNHSELSFTQLSNGPKTICFSRFFCKV